MPGKNIHKEPFDEGTITKLEIFQRYCREWLPVFVMAKSKRVNIFDFFAGTGYDIKGIPGSPIRILEEIKGQIENIKKNGTIIHIYLNEYDKKKQEQLIEAVKKYLDEHPELELVAIATDSGVHAEIALACMDRGIHVIVEKPMAMSVADAEAMIAKMEEKHVKLSV